MPRRRVALSAAVMASGAQAGQWGRTCVKAAKNGRLYTGHYTEKYCSTHATEAEEEEGKKNKFEWDPNSANIPFTSEGGVSRLKSAAGEIIKCEHDTDSGTFEGATKDKDVFRFTDCEVFPFGELCKSYGAKAGEIVTYELSSLLIDHGEKGLSGKEPAAGEVWMQETNTGDHTDPVFGSGPWLASFECQGVPFAVSGSFSGVVPKTYIEAKLKAGKAGKKGKPGKPTIKVEFTEKGGEQDLKTTFVNPENDEVETAASIQEGTNEIDISPLPKGLELNTPEA